MGERASVGVAWYKESMRRPRKLRLPLASLHHGAPGLAKEVAQVLYGAARVSFAHHGHPSPIEFALEDRPADARLRAVATWEAPGDKLPKSFQPTERIEKTAECVALAAVRARDGLRVCGRAEQLSGSDWLVSATPADADTFIRVEVSGLDRPASQADVEYRVQTKVKQLREGRQRGFGRMPGMVAVLSILGRHLVTERVPLEDKEEGHG